MEDKYISDKQFIEHILPDHYTLDEYVPGAIWCRSNEGLEADEWDKVFASVKDHFGDRFREVYHNVNYMHKHFCVYYKAFVNLRPQQV